MKKHPIVTGEACQGEIIKRLERLTANGRRNAQVFEDWLDLVHGCQLMLPAHAEAARTTGRPAEDTPEVAAIWAEKRKHYERRHFDLFAECYALLVNSTEEPDGTTRWADTIGNIYMLFGHPSTGAGQFFTPFPVAKMMAMMGGNCEELVRERLKEAALASPLGQAGLLATLALPDEERNAGAFVRHVLPRIWGDYKPVTLCDPCCGSGVMFLAAASCLPRWMNLFPFVQYHGIDIDRTCVKMATINLSLYGLNGASLRCISALAKEEIEQMPPHLVEPYTEAKAAHEAGNIVRVQEIRQSIGQLELAI